MSKIQVASSNLEALIDSDVLKELDEKYGIRLLEKIDEGSFGVVFKGIDLSEEGSFIAVKVTQQDREKYSSIEKSILSELNHPNIVKFKKFIEAHSNKYIAMEYVGNGNLFQLIEERRQNKKPFTEAEISQIMLNLLLAVKHMHENNVIHRDIKPENILLGSKDDFSQLKVSDFGLSVKYQDGAPFRSYSQCCGTVSFMAPEILLDKQYSKPIDIWSCGIILYMLFTMGKHPFKNSTETREEYVKRLSTLNTSMKTASIENAFSQTPLANDLFPRMVAKEPLNRYTVSQVLKHPFITRKLDASIPLSFQENTRIFIKQRKLAETIKAIMVLQYIQGKIIQSSESNFNLTRIPRPPSVSFTTQIQTLNNNEISSHLISSAVVPSSVLTDRTQLRSSKILFGDELTDSINQPDIFFDCETEQHTQQQQVLQQLQLPSRTAFSVDFSNAPQAIKIIPSRTPATPNQERKYARNNHMNYSNFTNSMDLNKNIPLQYKQLNQTPFYNHQHHLLSLPSISKSNTPLQQQSQQQQQQQQHQIFSGTFQQPQHHISSSQTPKSANLAAKIAQSQGSRAQRLRSQYQLPTQATTPQQQQRNYQIKANSLSRPGGMSVPTTPSQISTKTNFITAATPAGIRKATFQIKFLTSQPSSSSSNATPTNNKPTATNNSNDINQRENGVSSGQQPENIFQIFKSPVIPSQSILQRQQLKLTNIQNTNTYSSSNPNSPSNLTANKIISSMLSSQPIVCHTLNDSTTEDARNSSIFSRTHSHNNSIISHSSNNQSIFSFNSSQNIPITSATFHQFYGQAQNITALQPLSLSKSHSQSNLLDLEAKRSKETYKRSHFSNQPFQESDIRSRQHGFIKPVGMVSQEESCIENSIQQEMQKNFTKLDSFNLECGEKI